MEEFLELDNESLRRVHVNYNNIEIHKINKFTKTTLENQNIFNFDYDFYNNGIIYKFICGKYKSIKDNIFFVLNIMKIDDNNNESRWLYKCENLSTCFHLINKYKK